MDYRSMVHLGIAVFGEPPHTSVTQNSRTRFSDFFSRERFQISPKTRKQASCLPPLLLRDRHESALVGARSAVVLARRRRCRAQPNRCRRRAARRRPRIRRGPPPAVALVRRAARQGRAEVTEHSRPPADAPTACEVGGACARGAPGRWARGPHRERCGLRPGRTSL